MCDRIVLKLSRAKDQRINNRHCGSLRHCNGGVSITHTMYLLTSVVAVIHQTTVYHLSPIELQEMLFKTVVAGLWKVQIQCDSHHTSTKPNFINPQHFPEDLDDKSYESCDIFSL